MRFFRFGITIEITGELPPVNQAPTDITLSNNTIDENQEIGTTIGSVSAIDPDTDDAFIYSLVSGTGDTDNSLFMVIGDRLQTNAIFDYETQNSYSIRVETTDQDGLSFEKTLTIGITDVSENPPNQAPTNLTLSNNTIAENQAIGTTIGTFTTTDPDTGDTFTYSLVTGTGDTDNSLFTVIGDRLQTNAIFDYETQNNYSIRVKTTDTSGSSFEKPLNISITDLKDDKKAELENFTLIIAPDRPGSLLNPLARKLTPEEIAPLSTLPTPSLFPLGLLSFDVTGPQNGFQTEVQIILPPNSNVNSYAKLIEGKWQDFLYDGETGAEFKDLNGDGSNDVLLHLKDGARGDRDGLANGSADPGAPTLTTPGLYQVKGVFSAATVADTALQARWLASPDSNYEFGAIAVDDPYGRIDNLLPGTEGYLAAALARKAEIFKGRSNAGSNTLTLGDITGNFSNSESQSIGQLQGINLKAGYSIFYLREGEKTTLSVDNQFAGTSDGRGYNLLNFTDSQGRAVKIELGTSTFLTPTVKGGSINLDITLRRVAEYKDTLGMYKVDDLTGGLDTNGDGKIDLLTGQAGYAQEAPRRAQSLPQLQAPDNKGTSTSNVRLDAGQLFGLFIIPNASVSDVLDKNPTNQSGDNKPVAFFAYANANPDGQTHMTRLGSGNTSQFGFEDLMGGGDSDFNDLIVSMQVHF